MRRTAVALLILVFGGCSTREDEPADRSSASGAVPNWVEGARAAVRVRARQIFDEGRTPGMAVALTSRDGWVTVDAFGDADLKTKRPVTPETLFEIGSISKTITAVALLRLHDEGRFDLDAPVSEYLPWFEVETEYEPITGRHLLSHTSGLPRNRDDLPSTRYSAYAVREQRTGYPPGERFHYSNVGYQILGTVLEAIEGRPYAECVTELIFRPLGMDHSHARVTSDLRLELAQSYMSLYDDRPVHPSHPLLEATWLEYDAGDGSVVSTAADMAAFLRMLLSRGAGPGARVLAEETFATALHPPEVTEGPMGRFGYGIIEATGDDGHTQLFHWGGMVGFVSSMHGDLDSGLGVIAFVNGGPGRAIPMATYALRALNAARAGEPSPDPPPPPGDPRRIEGAGGYAGTYRSPSGDRRLVLAADGDRLFATHSAWPAGVRVPLESYDRFGLYASHPEVPGLDLFVFRFVRGDDGRVAEVFHGEDWYVGDTYEGPLEVDFPEAWKAYPGHYRSFSPWMSNFRVLLRKGELLLVTPRTPETAFRIHRLLEVEPGLFQMDEEPTPELVRFDSMVEGKTLRALWTGHPFYRYFTP